MTFQQALRQAASKAKWSPAKIAGEVGVSENTVTRWLNGQSEPRLSQYRALLAKVPGFAVMVSLDQKASA